MNKTITGVEEFADLRNAAGTINAIHFLFEINKIEKEHRSPMMSDILTTASIRQLEQMEDEKLYYGLTSYISSFKEFNV